MTPLTVIRTERNPADLKMGVHLDWVGYGWRPYADRPEEHRRDYDALRADMQRRGHITNPLIVWRGCVLIGMRRAEIARELGWDKVPCWEIQDDITADPSPARVFALRDTYEKVDYGGNL